MWVTTSILPLESSPSGIRKNTKAPTFSSSLESKVRVIERKHSLKFTKTVMKFNTTSNRMHLIIFKWIPSCHSIWRKKIKLSCIIIMLIQSMLIAMFPSHSPVTKYKLKTKNCFKWNEFVISWEILILRSKVKSESDFCVWWFLY